MRPGGNRCCPLRFLVPDLPRSRLLVIGAYQDEEVKAPGHPLRGLLAELAAQATLLPLAGLSAPEVAALMVLDAARPGRATDGAPQVGVAASAPLGYVGVRAAA